MTTRVLTLSAGTSNDNNAFFVEILPTLKAIKTFFERSYDKQTITREPVTDVTYCRPPCRPEPLCIVTDIPGPKRDKGRVPAFTRLIERAHINDVKASDDIILNGSHAEVTCMVSVQ